MDGLARALSHISRVKERAGLEASLALGLGVNAEAASEAAAPAELMECGARVELIRPAKNPSRSAPATLAAKKKRGGKSGDGGRGFIIRRPVKGCREYSEMPHPFFQRDWPER